MSPFGLILLLIALIYAAISLALFGWTAHGAGPAGLSILGAAWFMAMQWLRHRSNLKHRDSDFIPGTQHLAIAACLGWALATGAALVWSQTAIWRYFRAGQSEVSRFD